MSIRLLLCGMAAILASCAATPVSVTYTGTVDGKEVTAGYADGKAILAIKQK